MYSLFLKKTLKNNVNITFHYMIDFMRIKFSNYLLAAYSTLDSGLGTGVAEKENLVAVFKRYNVIKTQRNKGRMFSTV